MGGNESGGGGKPPTAAVSQAAPTARQYRNLATELRARSPCGIPPVVLPTVAAFFGEFLDRLQRKPESS